MNEQEIRKTNRKALPKLLGLVLLGGIVGGLAGYFLAGFDAKTLADGFRNAEDFFAREVAPWLLAALALLLPLICIPRYLGARKLLKSWDGEEESVSVAVDVKLSVVTWLASCATIVAFFLLAAAYAGGAAFESEKQTALVFLSIASFAVVMVESVVLQQKCVDVARRLNPEKKASVYDMKFQKKWKDSCDEAEKLLIGKCAWKAYTVSNGVCTVLMFLLVPSALFFDIGVLPALAVCAIWVSNHTAYCLESLRFSRAGVSLDE